MTNGRHPTSGPPTRGGSSPIGATIVGDGVNFSVFSRHATGVDILLFDRVDDARPSRVVPVDPRDGRSYHYWHAFVPRLGAGQIYALRVHGPWDPASGHRFDSTKVLLDPYGRAVAVPKGYSRAACGSAGDDASVALKSVVVDPSSYDWEGDAPLRRSAIRTIVYELHVRGFTRHPSSGVVESKRGTYAGLIEKIPYLRALGITAVELMPVFQFDPQDAPPGRTNYWGYAPVSFFAPHGAYASVRDPLAVLDEFRDMVKALHRAGIEVILDVVYNHTAEGDERGPTLGLRGIDNRTYYLLEHDRARYANYSGTGNTLNANHSVVRRMIVDSLRFWVEEMHVDGFRFDLASILARDASGNPMPNPPILWDIESDPALAGTKLIAEAWDAAGLYQVGSFVGDAWCEWNGRFRDDVRDFLRAAPGSLRRFADRLVGSPGVYGHKEREAEQSINFVTCHDGFTLNDLVSYDRKHNEDNGEGNRDGCDDNRSWNCGVEGPTDDPAIERLRNRQAKNFMAVTLLALGIPMFVMGDEMRRTQGGNNNAYCHDDERTWLDWTLQERHADLFRFVRLLLERRLDRSIAEEGRRVTLNQLIEQATKSWHGTRLNQPDWSDHSHCVALCVELERAGLRLHLMFNAHWEPHEFELPDGSEGGAAGRAPGAGPSGEGARAWRRWFDTGLDTPDDIASWRDAPAIEGRTYRLEARSIAAVIQPLESPAGPESPAARTPFRD